MTNIERLNNIFTEVFNCEASVLGAGFNKDSVNGWDSVRQLSLTAAVEDEFDIMLDPDDIIAFTSYEAAKQILTKNGIEL